MLVPVRPRLRPRLAWLLLAVTSATAFASPAHAAPSPVRSRTCSASGAVTWPVARGESWFAIAKSAGVQMRTLLKANSASASTTIMPGDVLCLPAGATPKATAASASGVNVALAALPVQGPCGYGDTWRAARANGRRHEGVDLLTATGHYVYAVVDGTLTRRAWDQAGLLAGNAWWLTSADGSGTYFFYAHLSAFAPGLKPGSKVSAGEIIGFVGETGSAAAPHLHFEIHPGGGAAVNPYSIVKSSGGCRSGSGYRQPNGWTPAAQ